MKKALFFLCVCMIATFWYSCTKDKAPIAAPVQVGNCDTTKVNYTKDIVPIISHNCLSSGCHGPGEAQKDFTVYANVKGDIDNILCRIPALASNRCNGGARMPSGQPPLPQSDSLLFVKWKADGFYDCH